MNQRYITFQQIVFYLTIISAFTGTLGVAVSVGSIHLFPFCNPNDYAAYMALSLPMILVWSVIVLN